MTLANADVRYSQLSETFSGIGYRPRPIGLAVFWFLFKLNQTVRQLLVGWLVLVLYGTVGAYQQIWLPIVNRHIYRTNKFIYFCIFILFRP